MEKIEIQPTPCKVKRERSSSFSGLPVALEKPKPGWLARFRCGAELRCGYITARHRAGAEVSLALL